MALRVKLAGDSLSDNPDRGRPAGAGAIRELTVIWPYVMRYVVGAGFVRIVRIKHGAQRPES